MPDESDESIAPRSGKVGDFLEGVGQYGLRTGWRVLMITYPVDEAFTDAGMTIPDGFASAIVGGMFTNKSGGPIQQPPVAGLCLLDSQGRVHAPASATMESHPGFRQGEVFDEETIAGHSFFLIPKDLGVYGVQWQAGGDVLTWLR